MPYVVRVNLTHHRPVYLARAEGTPDPGITGWRLVDSPTEAATWDTFTLAYDQLTRLCRAFSLTADLARQAREAADVVEVPDAVAYASVCPERPDLSWKCRAGECGSCFSSHCRCQCHSDEEPAANPPTPTVKVWPADRMAN